MHVNSFRLKKQIEYLEALGINTEKIYQIPGLKPEYIQDPEKQFTLDQFIAVLDFALQESGDIHYGLRLGQEPHLAGTIGMLCASCRNLKEAYIQGCKYFSLQGNFAKIDFLEDAHYPGIRYTIADSWTLKSPETARVEVEAMFSFLATIQRINSNGVLLPYRISFASSRPVDTLFYKEALGIEPLFEQEYNEIIFREKDLLIPMKAFNPEAFELLRSHIERQLKKINSEALISEKVRSILLSSLRYRFPDIGTVASKLNISSRTLQRQLSSEKTSFKALLQKTRFDLATDLLKNKEFTISEISYMLGYSDLGNFSRSFKKHAGISPQDYRRSEGIM
jgi:AraC-like DNA-binding protein